MKAKALELALKNITKWLSKSLLGFQYSLCLIHSIELYASRDSFHLVSLISSHLPRPSRRETSRGFISSASLLVILLWASASRKKNSQYTNESCIDALWCVVNLLHREQKTCCRDIIRIRLFLSFINYRKAIAKKFRVIHNHEFDLRNKNFYFHFCLYREWYHKLILTIL